MDAVKEEVIFMLLIDAFDEVINDFEILTR